MRQRLPLLRSSSSRRAAGACTAVVPASGECLQLLQVLQLLQLLQRLQRLQRLQLLQQVELLLIVWLRGRLQLRGWLRRSGRIKLCLETLRRGRRLQLRWLEGRRLRWRG